MERKPAMDLSALGGLKRMSQPTAPLNEEPENPGPPIDPAAVVLDADPDISVDNAPASGPEEAPENAPTSELEMPEPAPITELDPAMEGTAPLTFNLSEDLVKKVRKFNKDKKISYPNIVLNAVDATYDKLPSLLATEHFEVPTRNLFQRPSVLPTTTARDGSTRKEPMTMRMKKRYIAVLDQIAAELTDNNRTKLVETALKEYLKKEK